MPVLASIWSMMITDGSRAWPRRQATGGSSFFDDREELWKISSLVRCQLYFILCGNTTSEFDDLVTIGTDGLNLIQARCGTSPHEIRKKYPRFAQVGTVRIRHTLPLGNEDEIEEEIRNTIRTVGGGGGLAMSPQHAVQPDIPVETVETAIKAIGGLSGYPIE